MNYCRSHSCKGNRIETSIDIRKAKDGEFNNADIITFISFRIINRMKNIDDKITLLLPLNIPNDLNVLKDIVSNLDRMSFTFSCGNAFFTNNIDINVQDILDENCEYALLFSKKGILVKDIKSEGEREFLVRASQIGAKGFMNALLTTITQFIETQEQPDKEESITDDEFTYQRVQVPNGEPVSRYNTSYNHFNDYKRPIRHFTAVHHRFIADPFYMFIAVKCEDRLYIKVMEEDKVGSVDIVLDKPDRLMELISLCEIAMNNHRISCTINQPINPMDWGGTGLVISNGAITYNGGLSIIITSEFINDLKEINNKLLENSKKD